MEKLGKQKIMNSKRYRKFRKLTELMGLKKLSLKFEFINIMYIDID